MKTTLILPFLLGLAASDTVTTQCGGPTTDDGQSLTMQFTPSMPVQIAPISTVYGAIMTSYLNVVDCKYVMVQNVDNNPAQTGQFTGRTTVPVLTVYRVGCMPETTAVTRRDYRGYETTEPPQPMTALPDSGHGMMRVHNKREAYETSFKKEMFGIAERLASGIDPTNENITVREFKYLEQINTALFALNVVDSGFDLHQMCEYLNNASIANRLEDNFINASQASNIICFAAEYGLYFGMSNGELLADLAALEYAIQLHAYATQTLQELCEGLDYTAASFLGIDTEGIQDYICNGTAGISSTILPLSTSTMMATGSMTGSGGWGTAPTSYAGPTGTGSIVYGSDGSVMSSATAAAGTVAPWFNTTLTGTADITPVMASAGTAGTIGTAAPQPTSGEGPLLHAPTPRRVARYRF